MEFATRSLSSQESRVVLNLAEVGQSEVAQQAATAHEWRSLGLT